MKPFIETYTGLTFTPLDPHFGKIRPMDIAHALSHQCRFSGHVHTFYSVAEHSVRVSELLEAQGFDREVQLWGLLHDASEAYLVDLPSPLKHQDSFAPYRAAEDLLMLAVCARFGLDPEEPKAVRVADGVLLATEARDLMFYRPEHWSKLEHAPLSERIVPWSSVDAKEKFLRRFWKLRMDCETTHAHAASHR